MAVKKSAPKVNPKKNCLKCEKEKSITEFYTSYSKMHKDGKCPYCKECLRSMLEYGIDGKPTESSLKTILQAIDKPFIRLIYQTSLESDKEFLGTYIKNVSMTQYKDLGWSSSDKDGTTADVSNTTDAYLVEKWGNYPLEELKAFEKKYQALKNNYPEKTAMHTEALLKYIRYSCKEEIATMQGNGKDAKMWADLANTAATAAKINPNQLSAADLADGLSGFGQLVRAVEQAVDIIEILPKFKEKPQDKVDFTLWCYINYIRDLKGLPLCEYKEIYKFYEDRKKDYENRMGEDSFFDTSEDDSEEVEE